VTSIYRVASAWSETTATWDSPWITAGGDFNNLVAYVSYTPNIENCMITLDVTDLVSLWVNGTYENYGILLHSTGANYAFRYVSKEEETNLQNRPRLSITYTTNDAKSSTSLRDWLGKITKP